MLTWGLKRFFKLAAVWTQYSAQFRDAIVTLFWAHKPDSAFEIYWYPSPCNTLFLWLCYRFETRNAMKRHAFSTLIWFSWYLCSFGSKYRILFTFWIMDMLINHQKMLRIERYGPSNVSRHPASALVEKICRFEVEKGLILPGSRFGHLKRRPALKGYRGVRR